MQVWLVKGDIKTEISLPMCLNWFKMPLSELYWEEVRLREYSLSTIKIPRGEYLLCENDNLMRRMFLRLWEINVLSKNIMVCCKKVLNWNTWFPRPILARPLQSWLLGQSYQKGLLALEDERNQTIPCLFGNGSKIWDCVTNFSVFNRYFSDVRSCPMREQFKIVHKFCH